MFLKIFSNKFGRLVYINISETIKKGKSEGTTEFAQSFREALAVDIFVLENIIKENVKMVNKRPIIFLFIFKINM